MKDLSAYIKEISEQSVPILEMATIAKNIRFGNDNFRVAIHGPGVGDRDTPHIHIYLAKDNYPFNQFNFEVSLIDIVCYDEINLVCQKDKSTGINRTNRTKCSWEGYRKLYNGFEDWLFSNNITIPGDYTDNLDALIFWYNQENNSDSDNPLKDYIDNHGLKIHANYKKYFE